MHSIWQDFRYGLRGLRNQPLFTALALLALGLGIGAATTIFSVIQNVLLDPFPYKDADRVITFYIHDTSTSREGGRGGLQFAEFLDYKEQSRSFDDVIGGGTENVLLTKTDGTEEYVGGYVSENMFRFLGVPALMGRVLTPEDAKPGAPAVCLMHYKTWVKNFGQDPNILGKTLVLNGTPTTVVGVMPLRFNKLGADFWRPALFDRANTERRVQFQAKRKAGVSIEEARADLDAVAHRLANVYPKLYPKAFSVVALSWVDTIVGPFRKTLYTLAAAVGLLLLISCANVANLLLARASAREKEMAIRSALGASRARLVRQMLIESLALALGGMAIGVLFSIAGMKALVAVLPTDFIPGEAQITMNIPVLLFSIGLSALTSLIFGLIPALQTAKDELVEPLKDAGKGSSGSKQGRMRSTLVVVEVAMSLVLLAGAGLVMRSFFKMLYQDLGIEVEHVLSVRLPLPKGQYESAQAKGNFFRALLPKLATLPGVTAVTETSTLPPYGGIGSDIEISGSPTHSEAWNVQMQLVSEGYFPTLGLGLRRGRLLSEAEVFGARKVVVVNQAFITKYFATGDPLGQTVRFKRLEDMPDGKVENAVFEIIGVVADAKNQGIDQPPAPEAYLPYTITGAYTRGILVRTSGDPLLLMNGIRSEIWSVDRNVAITYADSLKNWMKQFSYAEPRFAVLIFSIFGGVGLALVALGVYSVIAYNVSRQTREIGIRMALGATRWDVLRMVMQRGGLLIAIGIAVGLAASFAATRVMISMLRDVSAHDPLTFGAVILLLGVTGLAACYFPARRATRIEPTVALRYE